MLGVHTAANTFGDLPQWADRYRDVDHPLVLARDVGHGRTVYDALGHGPESYASPARQKMLRHEVRWLLG